MRRVVFPKDWPEEEDHKLKLTWGMRTPSCGSVGGDKDTYPGVVTAVRRRDTRDQDNPGVLIPATT